MKVLNVDKLFNSSKLPLNDKWRLWRRIDGEQDFVPMCSFSKAESFGVVLKNIIYRDDCRYTIMKNSIDHCWENKHHINGGYFTIDIDKMLSKDTFVFIIKSFISGLVGRTLVSDFNIDLITGLTFIFDKEYYQIRLWFSNYHNKFNKENINIEFLNIILQAYMDNDIKKDISVFKSTFIVLNRKAKNIKKVKNLKSKSKLKSNSKSIINIPSNGMKSIN